MVPGSVVPLVLHCEHLHRLLQTNDNALGHSELAIRLHQGWLGPLNPPLVQIPDPRETRHRHREQKDPGDARQKTPRRHQTQFPVQIRQRQNQNRRSQTQASPNEAEGQGRQRGRHREIRRPELQNCQIRQVYSQKARPLRAKGRCE